MPLAHVYAYDGVHGGIYLRLLDCTSFWEALRFPSFQQSPVCCAYLALKLEVCCHRDATGPFITRHELEVVLPP